MKLQETALLEFYFFETSVELLIQHTDFGFIRLAGLTWPILNGRISALGGSVHHATHQVTGRRLDTFNSFVNE